MVDLPAREDLSVSDVLEITDKWNMKGFLSLVNIEKEFDCVSCKFLVK